MTAHSWRKVRPLMYGESAYECDRCGARGVGKEPGGRMLTGLVSMDGPDPEVPDDCDESLVAEVLES